MLRNAFAYITRKWPKSLLLFAIILLMGTLSLIGLSMKGATQKASSESLGSITNSFSMQINRTDQSGNPSGSWESQRRGYRKNQPGRGDHLLHQADQCHRGYPRPRDH